MRDRDIYTPKHPTPRAVPEFVEEDVTGQYAGEDLARIRSRRPTPVRISRLEEKHDSLVRIVTDVRVELGKVSGKLDILPQLVESIQTQQQAHTADTLDARKHGRQRVTAILGGIFSAGVLGALVHWLVS